MSGKVYESPCVEIKIVADDVIKTSNGDNDLVWGVGFIEQ